MSGVRLEAAHVRYGDSAALRGLDLDVADGELLVVLGPSGSGKTTLLRAVAGLQALTSGRVLLGGRDVTGVRAGARNVSMVFQSYALFPHLTVEDNIAFGLEVRGTPRREARRRAREAAEVVGCGQLVGRRPAELSGGERQRVALARALVRAPDVFLFDEPLSNLDAELRVSTRDALLALHERVGGTTIHVTHDQVEAMVLGDRVAVVRDGLVEQVGTPAQLWEHPATLFVAGFVGSPRMNLLPGGSPLELAVPAGATVGVRPESLVVEPARGGGGGTVERVDVVGGDAHVRVRLRDHALVARVLTADRPQPGDVVTVRPRPGELHVFGADGRRLPDSAVARAG